MKHSAMSHHLLASQLIFNQPLAIAPAKLQLILQVLAARQTAPMVLAGFDDCAPLPVQGAAGRTAAAGLLDGMMVSDRVALIDVSGTLVNRASWLDASSGLQNYKSLAAKFDAAHAAPDVEHIIMRLDTPGGAVSGLPDLAERIKAIAADKPVTAIIDDMSASAGMWLASAATERIASQTALLGSIGVIAAHVDKSKAYEDAGVKVTLITYGSKKAALSDTAPLGDEAAAELLAYVSSMGDQFTDSVAANLGLPVSQIRDQQAGVFYGKAALAAGLATAIEAPDAAIARIIGRYAGAKTSPGNQPQSHTPAGRVQRAAAAMRMGLAAAVHNKG